MRARIVDTIKNLLKVGVTPQKLALSLALGVTISLSPLLLGITTVLCIVVAAIFGLNQVAIQVANYAAYPLQLILIIPFMKAGEAIFSNSKSVLTIETIKYYIQNDIKGFFINYGKLFLFGTLAWLIIAAPLAILLHFIFLPIMKRLEKQLKSSLQ